MENSIIEQLLADIHRRKTAGNVSAAKPKESSSAIVTSSSDAKTSACEGFAEGFNRPNYQRAKQNPRQTFGCVLAEHNMMGKYMR